MSELQRLIFQDILPPEIIDKLCNISDFGDDESLLEDEDSKSAVDSRVAQKKKRHRGRGTRPQRDSDEVNDQSKKSGRDQSDSGDKSRDEEEEEDEERFKDDFSISESDEDEDDDNEESKSAIKLNDDSQIANGGGADYQSDNQSSRLSRTPTTGRKLKKGKVQFSDRILTEDSSQRKAHYGSSKDSTGTGTSGYKKVDLSVLYQAKNELVFKLTELYLPTTKNQRIKMYEYNREKMTSINDIDNEVVRTRKRRIKEEIKQVKTKLKHQIKYCNPSTLLEDSLYLYTPGMNSRQIDMMRESRNKYGHAPHIGRILPQKRQATSQQLTDQQRILQQQSLEAKQQQQQQEPQLKSYLLEDKYNLRDVTILQELEEQMTAEETHCVDKEYKQLEQRYFSVTQKMREENLSLTDLNKEEREVIKRYLKMQAQVVVESKYPTIKMTTLEKHCFNFMKHLSIEDYSYKGQKSAIQSDDTGMFMDDLIHGLGNQHHSGGDRGNNTTANSLSHQIFGLTHGTLNDDKLSQISGDNTFGRQKDFLLDPNSIINNPNNNGNGNGQLPNDHQIQEWMTEQKYKQIKQVANQSTTLFGSLPSQRVKYWGEPKDSASIKQVQKDNFIYKEFQNRQYLMRQGKDEKIFRIDKYTPSDKSGQHKNKKSGQESGNSGNSGTSGTSGTQDTSAAAISSINDHQIKDIKEYEYFKNQEKFFYADDTKKVSVNKIMRNIELELGMITEEEFYAQEELEDQMEQQQQTQANTTANSSMNVPSNGSRQQPKSLHAAAHLQSKAQSSSISNPLAVSLQQQQRKEQVLNDFIDNFDVHFERRKKELHEVMLKKIQQHEKANQQTSSSGQQQTVAYASGSHALLQATAGGLDAGKNGGLGGGGGGLGGEGNRDKIKHMVNMSKLREDQEYGNGLDRMNEHFGNQDEEMMGDEQHISTGMKQENNNQLGGVGVDDNMRLRVTKSRANELNHAKCILKLTYTRFDWSEQALMNFHRPNIHDVFDETHYKRDRDHKEQLELQQQYQMQMDQQQMVPQNLPPYIQLRIKVLSNDQVDKRPKKVGIINAHEFFRDRYKLSLKDGKFCIFEHIDQQPLFVNNFGMASKLKRYLYSDKFLPDSAFLKRRENQGTRHMGPHGVQILKKKGEKIPLLGQIDTKYYKGITVMENNMYYCPVFYHKPQRNDFLCVVHRDKQQNPTIIVRELSELYVMGQEEPKLEVYNPQSRQYQHFIKRRTQAYVIRFLQENHNSISFQELNKFFLYINDQILKKIIKEINVEVDRNQYCSLSQEYNDEQFRQLITPENICQYESAQYGEQMLKKVGIRDITNADKISYATNKFCSEEPNQKKQLIARIIEEEVLSTPWNLSQNFIHNKQTRGMMMLEGIGDPSHGHGGYSYLKLPLKISQDSLNKAKINRMYLNPAIQNPKAVTGTDADLRKLSKKEIKNKLIDLGFKEEAIASFTRWEMVALLRDKSSQAVSQGMEGEMKKFARGVRFTSKKQREMYQKQVNDIFKKQMSYLSKESGDFIQDYSDTETRDQRQKKINDIQQMNNNYSKNIVELKEDIEIKNIKDIPNFEILIMANQALGPATSQPGGALNIGSNSGLGGPSAIQTGYDPNTGILDREAAAQALKQKLSEGGMTYKCTILRKKIKPVNAAASDADKIERVIFCSDPRQIKGFNKRKHKHEVKIKRTKKTSLKDKMQTLKPIIDDFKDRRERSETSSVLRNPNLAIKGGPMSTKTNVTVEPVKIKLGNLTGNILSDPNKFTGDNVGGGQQPIRIAAGSIQIPLGGGNAQTKQTNAASNTIQIMQSSQQPSNTIQLNTSGLNQQQNQQPLIQIPLTTSATQQQTAATDKPQQSSSSSFKINIANPLGTTQQTTTQGQTITGAATGGVGGSGSTTIQLGLGTGGLQTKQSKKQQQQQKTYEKYMHSDQLLSNKPYDSSDMMSYGGGGNSDYQQANNIQSANVQQQYDPMQLQNQMQYGQDQNFLMNQQQQQQDQYQTDINQPPAPVQQTTTSGTGSIKIGLGSTKPTPIQIPTNQFNQPVQQPPTQLQQQQQQYQQPHSFDTSFNQDDTMMQYNQSYQSQQPYNGDQMMDYTNNTATSINNSAMSTNYQVNPPNPSPAIQQQFQQPQPQQPTTIRLSANEPVKISLGGLSFNANTSTNYGTDQSSYMMDTSMNSSAQQKKSKSKPSHGGGGGVKEEKKKSTSTSKPKKTASSKPQTTGGYGEEDFESYKPKNQNPSRRRQASGLALFNEFLNTVLDACLNRDKSKLFHFQVKKKDAPNYYDVIKNPIALMDMKAKAKREDYYNREMFMNDMELMCTNAEIYNGPASQIGDMARGLQELAQNMINQEEHMLMNYELLIQEQQNQILRI